ncbi:MAG: zf-HC2 domain-containing protein [Gemmatimonadota bacterium]
MSECTNGEMRDLLPELVSGRLGAEMQLEVEAHVAECEECAEELELLRALRPALMRGPAIDAAKIAAAVRAQLLASSQPVRGRAAPMWSLRIAAAAILAVGAIGIAYALRGRSATPEVAVTHAPGAQMPDLPVPDSSRTAPAPVQQVAVAPPQAASTSTPSVPTTVASVGALDNLSDLSDDDVRTLTASLNGMSAVPSGEPAPEIDPLGATLDDQSAGGTR